VLPVVAGEDHLPGAVALNSVQYNVARAVGPALGGTALAWGGAGWCFVLNALSFLIMMIVLATLRTIPGPTGLRKPVLIGISEGITFVRGRADLKRFLLMVGAIALGGAPIVSLLPALAIDVLHQDASGYARLLTAFGIGAAAVGLLLALHPIKRHPWRWVCVMAVGVGLCHIALAWYQPAALAIGITAAAGMCFVGAMIELGTGLLQNTPDEFRGRVSSLQQVIFRAAQPLGGLLAGLLSARISTEWTFIIFGGVLIAAVAAVGVGKCVQLDRAGGRL
jgi:predicted MFS family arabinose efflux permease